MGFGTCCIILDSPNLSYYAGQTIFGKLECRLDKVKDFRGIFISAKGVASVHWTTDHTRKVNDRTEHYKKHHNAHEEYFTVKQYIVGNERGESKLQPGVHVYPFQVNIPNHCPSSFEGKYGHIRYEIKAVVNRAYKADEEISANVRVVAPVDLNSDPHGKNPMIFELSSTYCCWCMSSGEVETSVHLPASGFCPGQVIPIDVTCNNHSSVDIHNVKLILKKIITFHAHSEAGTKTDEAVIAEIKKGPIQGRTNKNWLVEMEVPIIDACNVDACRIIDVDYKFKVKVNPEGCHSGTSDTKTMKIGTIPVVGTDNKGPNPLDTPMPAPIIATENDAIPQFNQPNQGYPNPPYPNSNPPYPNSNPPYPSANPPYPSANPPYPSADPPYPSANPPYPSANPPYPGATQPPGFGFKTQDSHQNSAPPVFMPMPNSPQRPAAWNQPPPTAPVPSTPITEGPESKPLMGEGASSPYNPDFMGK